MTLPMTHPMHGVSSELQLFRDTVVRFFNEHVEPHYAQWERDALVPREFWFELGRAGLLCVDVPEEYGGAGAPYAFSTVVVEEAARLGYGGLATNLNVHSDIAAPYVLHLGNEAQKRHWLPKMASGEAIGAICMTEPGCGSDLAAIKTNARRDGDSWVVNGSKTFITNGYRADVLITAVKTDPSAGAKGVSLFLLDGAGEGLARGRRLEKVGQHASDTAELFFRDMRVPADALLGTEGRGFMHMMDELPRERLGVGIFALGAAQGALERTIEYTMTRKAFGQTIASFQNTRFELARMKTELEVHRAFVEHCRALYEAGKLDVPTGAMVKLATTELQGRVTDACLQLFGGYGYMEEYPISRYWADARIQRIYGGTSEIMKEVIARSLVGRG